MLISALQYKSKFNFEIKKKKIQYFEFPCWSTRENFSIYVSITNVGLILTKLMWFQLFGTSQNSILNTIIQFLGVSRGSTREDLSIDVSITTDHREQLLM